MHDLLCALTRVKLYSLLIMEQRGNQMASETEVLCSVQAPFGPYPVCVIPGKVIHSGWRLWQYDLLLVFTRY